MIRDLKVLNVLYISQVRATAASLADLVDDDAGVLILGRSRQLQLLLCSYV